MMYDQANQDEFLGEPYYSQQFEQTQQASQSQDVTEYWDETIWGVLKPTHYPHPRIHFKKDQTHMTIGRASDNDTKLLNIKISNKHCEFDWDASEGGDTAVKVLDKSSNGTFINGFKIGRGNSALLKDGNEISFGTCLETPTSDNFKYIFRYMADGPPKDGLQRFYDIGHEIGRGSFASVYTAICRADGKTYALKRINRNRLRGNGQESTRVFMKEVMILEKLHHPNICYLKETFHEPKDVVLVLEYIDGGDLLDYIVNRDGLAEDEAKHLAFQLCKALKYIHAKGIAHRDLKPENILLTRDDPPMLKIADFGLAKAVDSMTRFRTMCGTPIYLAPEVILRNAQDTYSHAVDSWSTGVIVFAMLANANPFVDDDASVMSIRFRSRYIDWTLVESRGITIECRRFLERLLEENPEERMGCADALKHPWLAPLTMNDPEALDATPNDSFLSVQANAGSFLDQEYTTPQPPPPPTLPQITPPSSQELRKAGISSDFGQIRMDDGAAPGPSAPVAQTASEPQPTLEGQSAGPSVNRSQSRGLERHPMQIAEYDEDGKLKSFHAFPASPDEVGPVFIETATNGNNDNANDGDMERTGSASTTNAEPGDANGTHKNGTARDNGTDEMTPSPVTPATDNADLSAMSGPSQTNSRKRSAPQSSENQDADMQDEAPTKRSRAVPADVAA